jgi:hypothetical protein
LIPQHLEICARNARSGSKIIAESWESCHGYSADPASFCARNGNELFEMEHQNRKCVCDQIRPDAEIFMDMNPVMTHATYSRLAHSFAEIMTGYSTSVQSIARS